MKLMIDISENYYEILKYDVEHGNDYKPIVLIANGTPLPKGHGRLIDADKLVYWECNGDCDMCCDDDKCGMVKEAQTIIEADKESEAAEQ